MTTIDLFSGLTVHSPQSIGGSSATMDPTDVEDEDIESADITSATSSSQATTAERLDEKKESSSPTPPVTSPLFFEEEKNTPRLRNSSTKTIAHQRTETTTTTKDTCLQARRIIQKFIGKSKDLFPYDLKTNRIYPRLPTFTWILTNLRATSYGVNYSHEHAQECVGVMNQLLDIIEEEDEDISSVQSINKLAMAFAHLLSTWSSYSNIILVRNNANDPENISTSISTSPPISSHLLAMAVDAAQSLVAHGCLDVLQSTSSTATTTVINEHHHQEDDDAIHRISNAVCKMDLSTEECETSALKYLLTTACRISTTTNGSMLHGKSLLQLIRTAYHIYLKTGSETSKTTARAALQQMVASVFQRMEHMKNNNYIQDKTKETAIPAASGNEALQKFFANHPEVYSPRKDDNKDDKKDVAISTEVMYANVYKLLNFQPSTSLLLQRDQYLPFKKKADDSAKVLESAFVEEVTTNTSGDKATTVATASFASLAHLDAFLVLRSLCKLSMKTLPEGGGGGAASHALALNMTSASSVTEEVGGLDYDGNDRVVATAPFQPHASSTFTANLLVVHPAMESKILALELLLYVMDHTASPQELFSTPSFSFAIRHYLCVSLLKNCTSNNTRIVALSLRLFLPIIRNFREGLKPEIEAFVTNVFFVILESRNSTVEHKILVLTMFKEICSCEDTLAEIFLNYDCDLSAVDLFHRIVTALAKQGGNESSSSNHLSIYNDGLINSLYSSSRNARNMALRQSHRELKLNAMTALRQVLASLYATVKVGNNNINSNIIDGTSCVSGNSGHSSSAATRCFDNTTTNNNNNKNNSSNNLLTPVEQANGSVAASTTSSVPSSNIVKMYDSKRKRREQEAEIYIRFNQDPKAGLKYAGECGLLDIASPDEVAKFFLKNKDKLDKTQIGDYLGREPEYQNGFCVRVLHTYVDMIDLKGLSFDDAIRFFLSGFRLPGEAQKIDRIMEKFAERYCKQNPHVFPSADTAFILAFSVIMLNTDLHNPAIKQERRMTKEAFIRNNGGICDGKNLPDDFLIAIYDRIQKNQISLKEDDVAREKTDSQAGGTREFFFGSKQEAEVIDRTRETKFLQERDQIVRNTEMILQQQRRKASSKTSKQASSTHNTVAAANAVRFVRTSDALKDDYVTPMFEVTWGPALAVFSTAIEGVHDHSKLMSLAPEEEIDLMVENASSILEVCLSGFRLAICTAGHCGNETARGAFVYALYTFTRLGTGRLLDIRNVRCVQALLRLAREDGELLGNTWEFVFKALTEITRLRQVFDEISRHERGSSSRRLRTFLSGQHGESDSSDSSGEDDDSYVQLAEEDDLDRRAIDEVNALALNAAIPEGAIDKIYHRSSLLSNEAVKDFIFQLCRVSRMEISGYGGHVGSRANYVDVESLPRTSISDPFAPRKHQPIIYSLQQIVEVTHYNMESRSRLAFSEIWSTVAAHLTSTALHSNPAVALYAVDSLRQLSLQFLHREELGMFEFQRKFLKPYEVVMERSTYTSTKELLLNSVEQMVLMYGESNTNVDTKLKSSVKRGTLRSGWKSVLVVVGLAGHDEDDGIAKLGFRILHGLIISCMVKKERSFDEVIGCSSVLMSEHFVDLVDALFMFVSGPREELSLFAIVQLVDMSRWINDDICPLHVSRKGRSPRNISVEQTSDEICSPDLELWWPILLGFSRSIGHANVTVRKKCLTTLMELVNENFFPSAKRPSIQNSSNIAAKSQTLSNLQTLRFIFKGVLIPTLEHAEMDANTLFATPDLPGDFLHFALPPNFHVVDSNLKKQENWLDSTFDALLDSCISICLRSLKEFDSDDLVEEVLSMFNNCLVSDSGALAVKGLRRLSLFLTQDLPSENITSDTWATVSHMCLRCLVVRSGIYTAGDENGCNGANQIPEDVVFSGRRFIASNATMIIGNLLSDQRYASSMGLNWYLFLATGIERGIKEWEAAAAKEPDIYTHFLVEDSCTRPPSHLENALYGRKWIVRLMLSLAAKKDIEESQQQTVQQLLKEETKSLLSTFLEKESALGSLPTSEKAAWHVTEVSHFTNLVFELLNGFNQLDEDRLFALPWLCPMLSSLTLSNNKMVRTCVHNLVSRLFEGRGSGLMVSEKKGTE